jgi:hypothetical protein
MRKFWIRISNDDERKLDVIAEALGVSRSGVVRFLIRQWMIGQTVAVTPLR